MPPKKQPKKRVRTEKETGASAGTNAEEDTTTVTNQTVGRYVDTSVTHTRLTGIITASSRKKLRKLTHPRDHMNQDTRMEEESDEEADELSTTGSDATNDETRKATAGTEATANTAMPTDPNTAAANRITNQPFIPHGILKLPQSVASALATDFLEKREIRDLGVTCHWMLVSLSRCIIREPVSLEFAVPRLKRQRPVSSPNVRTRAQKFVGHIPNLFIGRLVTIRFSSSDLTRTEIEQLGQLSQLIDTRSFIVEIHARESKKLKSILPLPLPPHLCELEFAGWHNHNLLSLREFILPNTLQLWLPASDDEVCTQSHAHELVYVPWPKPSDLKELYNIPNSGSTQGLILPEGVTTVQFREDTQWREHITDITLPNSVTDSRYCSLLNIKWSDVTGRYYHDLPFPPQLKRLVLHCELSNDDFNLNEWRHMPQSCSNSSAGLTCQLTRTAEHSNAYTLSSVFSHPRDNWR